MKRLLLFLIFSPSLVQSQSKFAQLDIELPTPNEFRNAAGAPGHQYYQQKADYKINVSIDDKTQVLSGEETITYTNNSPDQLDYLWLQLDQNIFEPESDKKLIDIEKMEDFKSVNDIHRKLFQYDGGFKIEEITSSTGQNLRYAINKTMLRIDLEFPLKTKQSISFHVKWWYRINDRMAVGGRSGYEYFENDKNYLYTIAQWFPRMCVYNDVEGWQNKQFLGKGEFTLPFGDYEVNITVPSDHLVGATGELQNPDMVLTSEQRNRLLKALSSEVPVLIATEQEAMEREKNRSSDTKTWIFKATNVRDFAFAHSRKFIWDAQGVKFPNKTVLAMSYYPKEGNPLWERYSTKLVAHTIKTYSKYTVEYPYPVAISVHSKWIGMEYPMICFNGGRPDNKGIYTESTKYSMWGVIIHEVGHNFFPMIINSDERQWTWMDEGLNTFVQYLTEQEWERGYPSTRGPAYAITDYMRGNEKNMSPAMTNSESVLQFGNNAYGKPATALNILRESVMGRELFDHAFKTYCERWKFKHPTPADFFRTMEDASAVDLDWFWRGWFYTTENVDISISNVKAYQLKDKKMLEMKFNNKPVARHDQFIGDIRNRAYIEETVNEKDKTIDDDYAKRRQKNDTVLKLGLADLSAKINEEEKKTLTDSQYFYEVSLTNIGGLVAPVTLRAIFRDNSCEIKRFPAELWILGQETVSKVMNFNKEVISFQLDPFLESADTDVSNNSWPSTVPRTRFQLYEQKQSNLRTREKMKRFEK
jgi:hypothetical protein